MVRALRSKTEPPPHPLPKSAPELDVLQLNRVLAVLYSRLPSNATAPVHRPHPSRGQRDLLCGGRLV